MSELQQRTKLTAPPTLARLTARRIANPNNEFDAVAEIVPHDASTPVRHDPQTTWTDSTLATSLLKTASARPMPKQWEATQRTVGLRSVVLMRAGHFPQMFDFRTRTVSRTESVTISTPDHAALTAGQSGLPNWLVAALRTTVPANTLSALLASQDQVTAEDRPLWMNEMAAAKWDTGFSDEAVAVWKSMPAGAVRDFNLGVAYLALGRTADAVPHLTAAIATLPAESGWAHLAGVYLAICGL